MAKRAYSTQPRKAAKRYDSDLTDQEWALIEPELAQRPGRGRRRTVNIREVVNAIFCVQAVNGGCCQKNFLIIVTCGTTSGNGVRMGCGRESIRSRAKYTRSLAKNLEPSAAILDGQSVKTTESGGDKDLDANKKVKG